MKRRTPARRLLHFIEYLPILIFKGILKIVPEQVAYRFAVLLGIVAFHIIRMRRSEALENLAQAFPELDERALLHLAKKSYINIGLTFFEMLMINHIRKDFHARFEIQNKALIDQRLDSGAGLILVTSHFGSWEMTGAAFALLGYPVTAMAKRQANPHADAFILEQRRRLGMKIINHGAGMRKLVSSLRNRELIVLVSDQDAGRKGVFVDFFGHPASTPSGAANLALRYHTPIIVAMTVRERPGYYNVLLRDIPVLPDDTLEALVQRYTAVMEEIIHDYPEQYFWMHRRWKTQKLQQA